MPSVEAQQLNQSSIADRSFSIAADYIARANVFFWCICGLLSGAGDYVHKRRYYGEEGGGGGAEEPSVESECVVELSHDVNGWLAAQPPRPSSPSSFPTSSIMHAFARPIANSP